MRSTILAVALAAAATAASALSASALAHQTVIDPRGVAVTMHVLPGDEPQAGQAATIVIVSVKPPKGAFSFRSCGCRIKVKTASGRVLLDRTTGKRTPFVFPDPAAYEITYSGSYHAKGRKSRRFTTTFAIRANRKQTAMNLRMKQSKPALAAAVVSAGIAALAVPALSSGHATVSALQPQGPSLTAARGTYVVRAPNERETQNTWKVIMYVPAEIQESISFRQVPDWKINIVREDTGKTGEGGGKVFAVKRVSWTAKTKDAEIEPSMFGEWAVRWVNPTTPTTMCFGIAQYYRNTSGARVKPEIVNWTGDPATSATPRSCIDVKASA